MAADTTATLLGVTVYYLEKNKECLKKLNKEINKIGNDIKELSKEDLDNM